MDSIFVDMIIIAIWWFFSWIMARRHKEEIAESDKRFQRLSAVANKCQTLNNDLVFQINHAIIQRDTAIVDRDNMRREYTEYRVLLQTSNALNEITAKTKEVPFALPPLSSRRNIRV